MASFSILGPLSVELISATPQGGSGFAKYLKGAFVQLRAGGDFAGPLKTRLDQVEEGERGFNLRFAQDVPLGVDAVALTLSAASAATIAVYTRPGTPLFDGFIAPSWTVPEGRVYVALAIHPRLAIGLTRTPGNLSCGFEGGTEAEFRCYRPFETASAVTLGDACRELLETFTIPNTADDLRNMMTLPLGTIASVAGRGHLQIGCTVEVAAAFNPLASIDTIARLGPLRVGRPASARVGVQASVSGDYQVRVQTMAQGVVRLSYHTGVSHEVDLSLDASAGPAVTLGDRDLLGMLFSGPGGSLPDTVEGELQAAGVSQAQLAKITHAMRDGMSRRLTLELSAAFSALQRGEAAFVYDIDVAGLDAAGARAVDDALAGSLVALTRLEPELPAHGIAVVGSRTDHLRKTPVTWRVNLVGLLNVLSMSELARTGSVLTDEESGELVMADTVTSERVGGITTGKHLRKILFESVMLTATCKASGMDPNTSLSAAQSFFTMDRSANRQRMSDYLDAVVAMGLMPATEVEGRLGVVDDFGRSSLRLDAEFDQAACERLFSEDDRPRDEAFYEQIGKLALLALVQKRDVDAYRRIPLEDGALWAKMRAASTFEFARLLPPPLTGGDPVREAVQVEVVGADFTLIVWWASAMAGAARELADMRAWLAGPPAVAPDEANPEFRRRRDAVSRAMAKALQENRTAFGQDPWGLVAMFYASQRTAAATGAVISPRLTMSLPG